jgi:hypothetical protein
MTAYIGIALIGLSLIGLIVRVRYLGRKARLHRAIQAWVDQIVELYDSEDTDSTA